MSVPKGIKTVTRGKQIRLGSKNIGEGHPRMIGREPKVIRADSMSAILPKGMSSGKMIDESVGGEPFKF